MKRRDFIANTGVAAAGLALSPGLLRASDKRPNILMIMVDQMRHPMWTPEGITPNIDRLAARGMTFNSSFVSAVPCSPSRACLLTGTYTTQNKMLSNCDFVDGDIQPSLSPRIPTMGHIFRDAGYRTPYRGKWHLTRRKDMNKKDKLIDYGFEGWRSPDAPFGGPPFWGYVFDQYYATQAAVWLKDKNNHKQPWFLTCSLVNPHDVGAWPRYYPASRLKRIRSKSTPPNWDDDLEGKPACHREFQRSMERIAGRIDLDDPDQWRRYLDHYIRCVEDVDENIGDVLDALEKSGQKDNTIVVFTSDHGEMAGSHKLRNKGCFAYEENMRVPLIVAAPGVTPAGSTSDAFVNNVDILPTLAAMAGIGDRVSYSAGVDFSGVLANPDDEGKRKDIVFHNDWEIVYKVNKGKAGARSFYKNPSHIRCIRDREWKYAFYFSPANDDVEHELYNLKNDPLEMKNLADDPGYIDKRKELHEKLFEQERIFIKEYKVQ